MDNVNRWVLFIDFVEDDTLAAIGCADKLDWREEFKRLDGAYAQATFRSCSACFTAFEDWDVERGYTPLPARPSLVAAFIKSKSNHLKPATLRNRVCAIRKIHLLTGYDDPT